VDARHSNHEPNAVFQTGNIEAQPRIKPATGRKHPAIGSIIAKYRGANHPSMPAYAAFMRSPTHLAVSGYLGKRSDPFIANTAARLPIYDLVGKDTGKVSEPQLFRLPGDLSQKRISDRHELRQGLDRMRRKLDEGGTVDAMDRYSQQAIDLLAGRRMQDAL